ncbi:hypothetical protein [Bacillus sp. FJAT-27245]|uniref:hypothetical protein n=1 Tax=Bacillus sp. FJAT-27245 TaxID=1684144 RepID=UPI0006A76B0B|nr:hypothetical protein [Bacillus sp. FJAT-27245]
MRKTAVMIMGLVVLLSANAADVFAKGTDLAREVLNFGKMKPHMQQMHPDLSEKELKEMYESCHGNNGGKSSKSDLEIIPEEAVNSL